MSAVGEPTVAVALRRRVLIEDEDPDWHRLMFGLLDAGEYELASCLGPFHVEGGCPVLLGRPCPKVEWADTILHSLDQRYPPHALLLEALKRHCDDVSPAVLDGKPATYCLTRGAPSVDEHRLGPEPTRS